jgi:hypothetical protein
MQSRTRKGQSESPDRRWIRHPLYGEIRQIRRSAVGRDGQTYEWWEHDLTFFPLVPKGAVAGDVSKQVFCAACNDPKYFYVDEALPGGLVTFQRLASYLSMHVEPDATIPVGHWARTGEGVAKKPIRIVEATMNRVIGLLRYAYWDPRNTFEMLDASIAMIFRCE